MMLENVIYIDAPQSVVWNVTIDLERWPQWTPTVKAVKRLDDGQFDCGSTVLIKQPELPDAKWVVTALTPGERFTWESRIRGTRVIATHELSTQGSGTHSVLRIEMSGIVARFLWPLICISARRSLERENAGLKTACEASASMSDPE
jgi:uncharacterized membrane protein